MSPTRTSSLRYSATPTSASEPRLPLAQVHLEVVFRPTAHAGWHDPRMRAAALEAAKAAAEEDFSGWW